MRENLTNEEIEQIRTLSQRITEQHGVALVALAQYLSTLQPPLGVSPENAVYSMQELVMLYHSIDDAHQELTRLFSSFRSWHNTSYLPQVDFTEIPF